MSPRQDPQKLKPESLHRIARWGSGEQRWLGDCYTSTLKYVLGLASDWWVARASDSCFTTYVAERRLLHLAHAAAGAHWYVYHRACRSALTYGGERSGWMLRVRGEVLEGTSNSETKPRAPLLPCRSRQGGGLADGNTTARAPSRSPRLGLAPASAAAARGGGGGHGGRCFRRSC
jgi:hypothetical protein